MSTSPYVQASMSLDATDFAVSQSDVGGDLYPDETGDITTITGLNNLGVALRRRLLTPKGALTRFVRDVDGLQMIDAEYGNGALALLSEPMSTQLLDREAAAIRACLAQENRIVVTSLDLSLEPAGNQVQTVITCTYTLRDDQLTTDQVQLVLADTTVGLR